MHFKAEARPASGFTRLRKLPASFQKKIPFQKYLENMSSLAAGCDIEFLFSGNLSFPFIHYEEFDLETIDPVEISRIKRL